MRERLFNCPETKVVKEGEGEFVSTGVGWWRSTGGQGSGLIDMVRPSVFAKCGLLS